jgi:hypothetical protein
VVKEKFSTPLTVQGLGPGRREKVLLHNYPSMSGAGSEGKILYPTYRPGVGAGGEGVGAVVKETC